MSKCSKCPHSSLSGGRDSLSDLCDSCTSDPDTGWGGHTDHSTGKHYNSEAEDRLYKSILSMANGSDDDDDDDDCCW